VPPLARLAAAALAVALLVAVDVGTKRWASDELRRRGPWSLADGRLRLHYRENPGIAFGLLRDTPGEVRRPLLAGYALAVAAVSAALLAARLLRPPPEDGAAIAGLAAILAGTLGNLQDRIVRGAVIDFIDFTDRAPIDWPAFNVADVLIAVGMALCAVALVRAVRRHLGRADAPAGGAR
jgi:signal peptidase II